MAKEYVKIEGLSLLRVAARKLTEETQRKIAGNALVAGGRIIRNAARSRAPVLQNPDPRRTAGTLRKSIVAVKVRKGDHPDEVMAIVGVRLLSKASIRKYKQTTGKAGAANPRDPYYWWFVEAGTRAHARRGKPIAETRFLKRAFESNVSNAGQEIKKRGLRDILKFGNNLAKNK